MTNWCKYVNSSLESKTKEERKKGKESKEKGLYIYKVAQASLGHQSYRPVNYGSSFNHVMDANRANRHNYIITYTATHIIKLYYSHNYIITYTTIVFT